MSVSTGFKEQQRAGGFDTVGIEQLRLVALGSTSMESFIEQVKQP